MNKAEAGILLTGVVAALGVGYYFVNKEQNGGNFVSPFTDSGGGAGGGDNTQNPTTTPTNVSSADPGQTPSEQTVAVQTQQTNNQNTSVNNLQTTPSTGVPIGSFGQVLYSPNASTANGAAYIDPSGTVHALNFSSATYGETYATPAVISPTVNYSSGGSSSLNYTPAQNYTPVPQSTKQTINYTPALNYTPVSTVKETPALNYTPANFTPAVPNYISSLSSLASSDLHSFPNPGQPFTVAGYTFTSIGQYYHAQMSASNTVSDYNRTVARQAQSAPSNNTSSNPTNRTSVGGLGSGTYTFGSTTVTVKEGGSGKYKTTL